MRSRDLFLCFSAVAGLAGCQRGPSASHTVLRNDYTSLRAAFNADSGKVRAIFLASPT